MEIAAGSNDVVTLRGIKVSAPPGSFPSHEVVFTSGAALDIENCVVEGGVLGIDIFPFGFAGDVNVFIRDTVVSNAGDGIRVAKEGSGSVRGTLERCSMEGNGDGLDVRDGAAVCARDCVITRARFHGVVVGSSSVFTTQLTLEGCVINNNNVGIGADNANSVVRVSNSTITDNQKGIDIFVVGVSVLSRGNNTLEANTVNGAFNGVYTAK